MRRYSGAPSRKWAASKVNSWEISIIGGRGRRNRAGYRVFAPSRQGFKGKWLEPGPKRPDIRAMKNMLRAHLKALWAQTAEPLLILGLVFFSTTAIAQPFYVPSGSMQPTIAIGDALIGNKFAYGWSRWS